jgi:hypothetical protein
MGPFKQYCNICRLFHRLGFKKSLTWEAYDTSDDTKTFGKDILCFDGEAHLGANTYECNIRIRLLYEDISAAQYSFTGGLSGILLYGVARAILLIWCLSLRAQR